jgi:hypothetical protein
MREKPLTSDDADEARVVSSSGSGWYVYFYRRLKADYKIARGSLEYELVNIPEASVFFKTKEKADRAYEEWRLVKDAERRLGAPNTPGQLQRHLGESDDEFRERFKEEWGW